MAAASEEAAAAAAEEEEEAVGVRPPRGAPPPFPYPPQLSSLSPGRGGGRGAEPGGGTAPSWTEAHPSSERTPLSGTLWRCRRCGGPRRCACGAPGRRGERPLPCPAPAGVARRKQARRKASERCVPSS